MDKENVLRLVKLIGDKKFLYISGNGGSGKTSFANEIKKFLESQNKKVNMISTNDFITDTTVRNNSLCKWNLDEKEYHGRYTSCCRESYFWRGLETILYSLKNGKDIFYQPKRSDIVLLSADAELTIVEGIGTVFMDKQESVSFWFECGKETEIQRRMKRGNLTRKEVEDRFDVRESQFKALVLPFKENFDYQINTENDKIEITKI